MNPIAQHRRCKDYHRYLRDIISYCWTAVSGLDIVCVCVCVLHGFAIGGGGFVRWKRGRSDVLVCPSRLHPSPLSFLERNGAIVSTRVAAEADSYKGRARGGVMGFRPWWDSPCPTIRWVRKAEHTHVRAIKMVCACMRARVLACVFVLS